MTLFSLIRLCGRYGRWQLSLQRDINVAMHFMQKSNYIEDALIKHHKLDRAINWSTCCHFRKRESLHLRRNCEISRAPCINLSRIPGNGLLPHPSLIKQESVQITLNKSRRGPTAFISLACSRDCPFSPGVPALHGAFSGDGGSARSEKLTHWLGFLRDSETGCLILSRSTSESVQIRASLSVTLGEWGAPRDWQEEEDGGEKSGDTGPLGIRLVGTSGVANWEICSSTYI